MKRLGDWRLPLIFAVPVALLVVVGYLALQPPAGTASAALAGSVSIKENATPRPAVVPTPYPSVAPVAGFVAPAPCSAGVSAIRATASFANGQLILRVVDQRGTPVVCAWFQPVTGQGQSYEFYGDTQGGGTLRLTPPASHFSVVEEVFFGSAETALAYSR